MREMKDSGIPWIGEIPKDWAVIPIKRVKDITHPYPIGDGDHGAIKPEDYQSDGIPYIRVQNISWGGPLLTDNIVYISEEAHSKSLKSELHPNDLVIAKTGATIGKTGIIPRSMPKANTTSSVAKLSVGNNYSYKFIFYLLGSDICRTQMWLVADQKSAQPGFNVDELVCFQVPMPFSYSEQQRIADFLDSKCAEIDTILEQTRASFEEYKKLKQSVITKAVTKGIRGVRPMKDSGVEWIGEIPEEWSIIKFGRVAKVASNLVDPADYPDYPQIAPDSIEKGSGRLLGDIKTVKDSNVISWNHLFHKGQIIYSKIRPLLNKLVIAPFDGLCSADMYPIETEENTRFFVYLMLSNYFLEQIKQVTEDRVKMPKVNQEELSSFRIILPSQEEQQEIATYLDDKCAAIDSLIASKEALITELESYKKSLIYEYVTGKKEVY